MPSPWTPSLRLPENSCMSRHLPRDVVPTSDLSANSGEEASITGEWSFAYVDGNTSDRYSIVSKDGTYLFEQKNERAKGVLRQSGEWWVGYVKVGIRIRLKYVNGGLLSQTMDDRGILWNPTMAYKATLQSLQISGATGNNAYVINGIYEMSMDGPYNGSPAWQKRGLDDSWLVRTTGSNWLVTSWGSKAASSYKGWAWSSKADLPISALSWIELHDDSWQSQSIVVSEAHSFYDTRLTTKALEAGKDALSSKNIPEVCGTTDLDKTHRRDVVMEGTGAREFAMNISESTPQSSQNLHSCSGMHHSNQLIVEPQKSDDDQEPMRSSDDMEIDSEGAPGNVCANSPCDDHEMEHLACDTSQDDLVSARELACLCDRIETAYRESDLNDLDEIVTTAQSLKLTHLVDEARRSIEAVKVRQVKAVLAIKHATQAEEPQTLSLGIKEARRLNVKESVVAHFEKELYRIEAKQDLQSAAERCDVRSLRSGIARADKHELDMKLVEFAKRVLHASEAVLGLMEGIRIDALRAAIGDLKNIGVNMDSTFMQNAEQHLRFLELEKAKSCCFWTAHYQHDLVADGDRGSMSARNIDDVKSRIVEQQLSGFSVWKGDAYLKSFTQQLKHEDLNYLPDSTNMFYIATQVPEVGVWRRDEHWAYEISFAGGNIMFEDKSSGSVGVLVRSPEWLEGDIGRDRIRLKLLPDGTMLSKVRACCTGQWDADVISTSVNVSREQFVTPKYSVNDIGCSVLWQYRTRGGWKNCESPISIVLEEAFHAGVSSVHFQSNEFSFEIAFDEMKQYGGETRDVRRHFEVPSELVAMMHPSIAANFEFVCRPCCYTKDPLRYDVRQSVVHLMERYVASVADSATLQLVLPKWRNVDVDAAVIFAAISVALFTKCPYRELTFLSFVCGSNTDNQQWQKALNEAFATMQNHEEAASNRLNFLRDGGYSWLRHSNDSQSRFCRLSGSCSALRHMLRSPRQSCIGVGSNIRKMMERTQLLDCASVEPALLPHKMSNYTQIIYEAKETLLEVAASHARDGAKVVAVSAASAYRAGGGLLSGGRHALEEAICMQSTLYFSLAIAVGKAKEMVLRDSFGRDIHIPERGCVLSPDVEILRQGTNNGYSPMRDSVPLAAIISVAMPNRNHNVADSPVDSRRGFEYRRLLNSKFETVVLGAIQVGADILVIPDCGCGVFKNDPSEVGKILGKILHEKRGYFKKVILVGSTDFAKAVLGAGQSPRQSRDTWSYSWSWPF